ncbi:kinase-like domain-containing protein [Gorgonomyces haynaldii]|nr:kinase-like domain-containing protein [Gorgonomyces haynaldii]
MNGPYFRMLEDSHREQDVDSQSFNQGYYDRFFVEQKKLGRGQRGNVFLCQHVLDRVVLGEFAIKAIPVGASHQWLVRMLKEVRLLERLRHPNIIEYKHAWLENRKLHTFGPEVPCLFILMELANGGNLEEYIQLQWDPNENTSEAFQPKPRSQLRRRQKSITNIPNPPNLQSMKESGIGTGKHGKKVKYLTFEEIYTLFNDICQGLQHLHKNGILHRDIKPANLLLRYTDRAIPYVLLSDFGECEIVSDEVERKRTGATGTLEFMPPELLFKDQFGNYVPNHSTKADMWSLGVLLYFLCYSSVPYKQTDDVDILKEEILEFDGSMIHFPDAGDRVPDTFRQLIVDLLAHDPEARPDIRQVIHKLESLQKQVPKPIIVQKQPETSFVPLGVFLSQVVLFGSHCFPVSLSKLFFSACLILALVGTYLSRLGHYWLIGCLIIQLISSIVFFNLKVCAV